MSHFTNWHKHWTLLVNSKKIFDLCTYEAVLGYLLLGEGCTDKMAVRFMMSLADRRANLEQDVLRLFALDHLIKAMFYRELKDPNDQSSLQPYNWKIVCDKDEYFAADLMLLLEANLLGAPDDLAVRIKLFHSLIEAELAGENSVKFFFELALHYEWGGRLLKNVAPTKQNFSILTSIACPGVDPYKQHATRHSLLVDVWRPHLQRATEVLGARSFAAQLALKIGGMIEKQPGYYATNSVNQLADR